MQSELLREVEQKLQDQAATLDMRSASLQALVEEKVGSLEEKLRDGCPVVSEKSACEVTDQLTRGLQDVLERVAAIEAKSEQPSDGFGEDAHPSPKLSPCELRKKVSEDVQSGLFDLFSTAQRGSPKAEAQQLAVDKGVERQSPKHASSSSISDGGAFVPEKDFNELKARVEGGFDALVVQMTANTWIMEEADNAADKIVQAFSFNLDNRVTEMESRVHKSEVVLDRLCQRGHLKVKHVTESAHCLKCGNPMDSNARTCERCGAEKKVKKQITVPKKAIRAAQEHNFHMMKVTFDLWARGLEAECLTEVASRVSEQRGERVTPHTLTKSETKSCLDAGTPLTKSRSMKDPSSPGSARRSHRSRDPSSPDSARHRRSRSASTSESSRGSPS